MITTTQRTTTPSGLGGLSDALSFKRAFVFAIPSSGSVLCIEYARTVKTASLQRILLSEKWIRNNRHKDAGTVSFTVVTKSLESWLLLLPAQGVCSPRSFASINNHTLQERLAAADGCWEEFYPIDIISGSLEPEWSFNALPMNCRALACWYTSQTQRWLRTRASVKVKLVPRVVQPDRFTT